MGCRWLRTTFATALVVALNGGCGQDDAEIAALNAEIEALEAANSSLAQRAEAATTTSPTTTATSRAGTTTAPTNSVLGGASTEQPTTSTKVSSPSGCTTEEGVHVDLSQFQVSEGGVRQRCTQGGWIDDPEEADAASSALGFDRLSEAFSGRFLDHEDPRHDCSYFNSCSVLELRARKACSGGYVEANFLNDSGQIVDFTNDSIPVMRPGDTYLAVLGVAGSGGRSIEVTKIECYDF